MKQENDLPKSIVVVLVVLAVAISVLGTFTVLNEMKNMRVAPIYGEPKSNTGKISLQVEDPGQWKSSGKISLTVEEQEGN